MNLQLHKIDRQYHYDSQYREQATLNDGTAVTLRAGTPSLQITGGVDALLVRYYLLNNANLWLWGVRGRDETRGWELLPTTDGTAAPKGSSVTRKTRAARL